MKRLKHCHNVHDFRSLARRHLPRPIFDYIDGGADDEVTQRRNSQAFEEWDLVPAVLAGGNGVDMSTSIMGQIIQMPLILSPTALQRMFHHEGELAVARAAEKFGIFVGLSSLGTVSIEEIGRTIKSPKLFQLYLHKDKGLNNSMIERCKEAGFEALALTVDTVVGGNRERDLRTGFTSPPKLTPSSTLSFVLHPRWSANYLFRSRFELPQLQNHVEEGTSVAVRVGEYFERMLDPSIDWRTAEDIRSKWDGAFCLKGVMSADDARRAVDVGADAIMVSNHGGRQLDGARAPLDQLCEIMDAVEGRLEVICDGGIRRGTHVLKALSLGARCCSVGRLYLYALAAAGQAGVERVLSLMRTEIERDMKLMGVGRPDQLSRQYIRASRSVCRPALD